MNKKHSTRSLSTLQPAEAESVESAETIPVTRQAKNEAAIRLLRSWREGNEQEQRKTWEYLKRALDEDRLSYRKLFAEAREWREIR